MNGLANKLEWRAWRDESSGLGLLVGAIECPIALSRVFKQTK
jgi:hypothetical protein